MTTILKSLVLLCSSLVTFTLGRWSLRLSGPDTEGFGRGGVRRGRVEVSREESGEMYLLTWVLGGSQKVRRRSHGGFVWSRVLRHRSGSVGGRSESDGWVVVVLRVR